MGNLIEAIEDDIRQYESLCKYYNEKPVIAEYGVDPYCKHAWDLQKKYTKEIKNRRK